MDGACKKAKRWTRPKRPNANREAKRWDDPGSDEEDVADKEAFHPQTDQGDKPDDDEASEDAMVASDSEGENDGDDGDAALLEGMEARRRAVPKEAPANGRPATQGPAAAGGDADGGDGEGLWDPLAGLAPRKRRKVGQASAQQPSAATKAPGPAKFQAFPSRTQTFGFPAGTVVCLVDLQKAPQLNGTVGTVAAAKDQATGRVQVVMRDGTAKSLRQENLKEVLTGAVVRLHGLQGAAELNGRIAECGDLDLAAGRYNVILADGKETVKRVKAENIELVKRYVAPVQILSVQQRAFVWEDEIRRGADAFRVAWSDSLTRLADLALPAPRLVSGEALARLLDNSQSGEGLVLPEAISADKAPVDGEGRLACRLLAVSPARDACAARDVPAGADVRRLAQCAKALMEHDATRPPFFLLPQTCVKALPCLRSAVSCAWPLYLQLCQGLLCMDTVYRPHKAWCRAEALVVHLALSKPVYLLSAQGEVVIGGHSESARGGWLLSDRQEEVTVANPMDGHVLPTERALLEKMVSEVVPKHARRGTTLTMYRL